MATPNIAGYDIGELLGRGGFASVHKAVDTDGVTVAIKVLFAHVSDTGDLKRFERERLSMSALGGHPHIVGILDSGENEDGQHWMALEYVDGGSIKDQLASTGAFHWSTVTRIGVQLCSALSAAHRSGVLHRDIKPANILDDGHGAKLADFGIARLTGQSQLTAAQSIIGTLAYTPPEILHNQGFDGRGDIYQLGISLYEMLLGRAPFKSGASDNKAMVIRRILENPAPPLAQFDVPQPLSDLLDDVLAKDPSDRPQTAEAFGRRLNEVEVLLGRAATRGPGIGEPTPPLASSAASEPTISIAAPEPPSPDPVPPAPTPPVIPVPPPVAAAPVVTTPDPDATLADFTRPDQTRVMPQPETAAAHAVPPQAPATAEPTHPVRRGRIRTIAVVLLGLAAVGVAAVLLVQALQSDTDPDVADGGPVDDTELDIVPTLQRIEQDAFAAPAGSVGITFGAVANELGLTAVGGAGDGEAVSQQQSVMWTMNDTGVWSHREDFAVGDEVTADAQRLRGIGLLDRVAFLAVGESGRTGTDGVAWIGDRPSRMQPVSDASFTGPGSQRLLGAAGDNSRGEFLVVGSASESNEAQPALWVVAKGTDWTDPVWAQVPLQFAGAGALADVAVAGDIAVAVGHESVADVARSVVLVRREGAWSPLVEPIDGVQLQAVDLVGDRIVAVGNRFTGTDVVPVALVADVAGMPPQLHQLPSDTGDARAHDVVATRAGVFAVGVAAEVAGSGALGQGLADGAIWQLLPADDPADDRWTTRDSDELRVDGLQEFWSVVEFDGAVFALGRAVLEDGREVAAGWTVTVDLGDSVEAVDDVVEQAQREAATDSGGDSPLGLALTGCAAKAVSDARTLSEDDALTLRPVLIDATEEFALWICADGDGGLWYHGAERDGPRSITLPAAEVAGGYEALNVGADGATTTYRVVDGRLTVQNPSGSIALDQPLLDN